MPLVQSPNKAYKQYRIDGGTKSFTGWLHTEKEKMYYSGGDEQNNLLLVNRSLNDSINSAIDKTLAQGGLKTSESGKTVFGINKWIIIGAGALVAGVIGYIIYKNVKPEK